MIGHIIDDDHFVILTGNNAGDVFLKFVVVFRFDEVLSSFDGEHDMDINLRVGVCHVEEDAAPDGALKSFFPVATKISRLRCFFLFETASKQGPLRFNQCFLWNLGFEMRALTSLMASGERGSRSRNFPLTTIFGILNHRAHSE